MGGHSQGAHASQTINQALAGAAINLPNIIDPPSLLYEALSQVNRELFHYAKHLGIGQIVGATVAVLCLYEDQYHVLWAGDSRCYLYRHDTLVQLTEDHKDNESVHLLTNAVGIADTLTLAHGSGVLHKGDAFLLCTDGLTGAYTDQQLEGSFAREPFPSPHCQWLLEGALNSGVSDNVSAVIVRIS
jgi:protein phosphatase